VGGRRVQRQSAPGDQQRGGEGSYRFHVKILPFSVCVSMPNTYAHRAKIARYGL
jgi:hypothetical protein